MTGLRVSIEWYFGVNGQLWPWVVSGRLQIYKQPVAKLLAAAQLLSNCHACLYGNIISRRFNLLPPALEGYLHSALIPLNPLNP